MTRRNLGAVLAALILAAGCGRSPSSPSPSPAQRASTQAAESAVMSAMAQAMSQMALAGRTFGDSHTFTLPCPNGGSMVMTMNPLPSQPGGVYRSSSRVEFRDCRSQTVTINGDPHLDTSIEASFTAPPGATGGDSIATMRTTGGLRMNSSGVQGRVQFNCTTTVTISMGNGTSPQVSVSSSGTMTFEQPIGSTPVARPCGPA